MILFNPTGKDIRSDSGGCGRFGSKRGKRKHEGTDFLCEPEQVVRAVIQGRLVRAFPYANDLSYTGCRIWGKEWMAKMFYFKPYEHLINESVLAGEVIGIAQDISQKYGCEMKPHIHVGLYKLNPTLLVNPEDYLDADKEKLRCGGY